MARATAGIVCSELEDESSPGVVREAPAGFGARIEVALDTKRRITFRSWTRGKTFVPSFLID